MDDRFRLQICAALLAGFASPAARAQDYGDPSGNTLIATADLRLIAADGERSWIDGRLGKSRFGGDADPALRPVEANLVWSPDITWSLGGTIALTAQGGQDKPIDLSETYLSWRRAPHGAFRFSARAGLYWPPVSFEHSGPEWAVTETITPSAINSWIGEEVKLGGAEATGSWAVGKGRITATLALFGFNDTAGTLLAFRGWALHDEKATAFSRQPLPPLDDFMRYAQAPFTSPVIELDNRPGFYGRLGWAPAPGVKLHGFYYDNRGDPEAVDARLQWGWRTRFAEAGGTMLLGERTRLTAQAMRGSTQMGYPMPDRLWVDTRFRSAFALVTRRIGQGSVSGRIEAFGTTGGGSVLAGDDSEDGWAATLAAKRPFGEHVTLLAEALHIDSDRSARERIGVRPAQDQTILQLALRLRR